MERVKTLRTKDIIECLLRLDEFKNLPMAVHIAFKKHIILEYNKQGHGEKAEALSPEEHRLVEEYSAKYMPAIRLNLDQCIYGNLMEYKDKQTRKIQDISLSERITPDTILLMFIRASRIDDLKFILPIPLNA